MSWELLINLVDGRNLIPQDYIYSNSDPFVSFTVHKNVKISSVISQNLNPEWKETFSFEIDSLDGEIYIEGSFNLLIFSH